MRGGIRKYLSRTSDFVILILSLGLYSHICRSGTQPRYLEMNLPVGYKASCFTLEKIFQRLGILGIYQILHWGQGVVFGQEKNPGKYVF